MKKRFLIVGRETGFSLVEMMMTVSVVGIIAAVAIPKYKDYTIKAMQAEASANLSAIHVSQETYRFDNGTYFQNTGASLVTNSIGTNTSCNSSNPIGFSIANCQKARYTYDTRGNDSYYVAWASEMVVASKRRLYPECIPKPLGFGLHSCPSDGVYQIACDAEYDAKKDARDYWETSNGSPRHPIDVLKACK